MSPSYISYHSPSINPNIGCVYRPDPNDPNAPDKSMRTAIIFAAVHFTIVALASFVGFIGACGRKRSLVAFYSVFLWISVLINLGLGIYYVYQTIHNFDNGVDNCKAAAKNAVDGNGSAKDVGKVCLSRPLTIGLSIGVFIIELLLMLCASLASLSVNKDTDLSPD